jgi:hypothetical protein
MKVKEAIKKIDKQFFDKVKKIEKKSIKSELDKTIKNIRLRIYKSINIFLPRYMKLNLIDHKKLINHMSTLKREYYRRNYVEDIQSNLFKLGLFMFLFMLAIPETPRQMVVQKISNQFKILKDFIKNTLKSITTLDPTTFFNSFIKLVKDFLRNFFNVLDENATFIDSTLAVIGYLINTLFMIELACLVKIAFLDSVGMI